MRLPSLSSRAILSALRKAGFTEAPDRGKGSHRDDAGGKLRLVIVPYGKDIPRGTLLSILDQAGLTREEFLKFI